MLSFIADILGIVTGTITLILLFKEHLPKLLALRAKRTQRRQRSNPVRKLFYLFEDYMLYLTGMGGALTLGAAFSEYLFEDRIGTLLNRDTWGTYVVIFGVTGSLILTIMPEGPGGGVSMLIPRQ